jgi:hypothetical protein
VEDPTAEFTREFAEKPHKFWREVATPADWKWVTASLLKFLTKFHPTLPVQWMKYGSVFLLFFAEKKSEY